jgi:hypothetical protein
MRDVLYFLILQLYDPRFQILYKEQNFSFNQILDSQPLMTLCNHFVLVACSLHVA